MENPSKQESEPKIEVFGILKFFFEKSGRNLKKRKTKILLILFASKCLKNPARQNLCLFLPYETIRTGISPKLAFFGQFWCFSSVANLHGVAPPKSTFRTRFWKFGSNHEDWGHKKPTLCSEILPKNEKQNFFRQKMPFFDFDQKSRN